MNKSDADSNKKNESRDAYRSTRETFEAFAIALVFAFLFKAYIIELYSIPTGSMASTLMGRHRDVSCTVCGTFFQFSASPESNEGQPRPIPRAELPRVIGGTCPQCHFTMYVGEDNLANDIHISYGGDRIFVNKALFSYREPTRWHVTVFRYPHQPQVNYIKRLIGVENETVMLRNGQVFARKDGSDHFEIQRKPLRVLRSVLLPVDDNNRVVPAIHELGWLTRWYSDSQHWQRSDDYRAFTGTNDTEVSAWLMFRHIVPTTNDWENLLQGRLPGGNFVGIPQLITDNLDYNTQILQSPSGPRQPVQTIESPLLGTVQMVRRSPDGIGLNWVGDLVIRCTLNVERAEGVVSFRLVKGGTIFQCDIDLAARTATFSILGMPEFEPFAVDVPIQVGRNHEIMFCNVDEELRLIIDGREIDTQGRGRYEPICCRRTHYRARCIIPGPLCRDRSPTRLDMEPAAIGIAGNAAVQIADLKILRNMYIISTNDHTLDNQCDLIQSPFPTGLGFGEESVRDILSNPARWANFGKTRRTTFELGSGQFLMCGDNSASSSDSRLWTHVGIPHHVERQFLIGEAIYVFWPRGLRIPGTRFAWIPNFPKMRWID